MATSARRITSVSLLSAALCLSTLNPALADDNRTKPKPSAKMEFKNAKEKFKSEIDAYKSALKAREEAREKINETFKATIKKATSDANVALSNATTAEQKLIIMNTLKNARTAAVAIRDAALAALGSMPTPPAEAKKDAKGRTLAP
jgi:phenylalanyl-tRNA synthetase alpha subunit